VPIGLRLRQRNGLVLPALLEIVPAVDGHLRLHVVLSEEPAHHCLGLVDRLDGRGVRVDRVALAAHRDGAAEAVPDGVVGLMLAQLLEQSPRAVVG
jgi:hypothetical protein